MAYSQPSTSSQHPAPPGFPHLPGHLEELPSALLLPTTAPLVRDCSVKQIFSPHLDSTLSSQRQKQSNRVQKEKKKSIKKSKPHLSQSLLTAPGKTCPRTPPWPVKPQRLKYPSETLTSFLGTGAKTKGPLEGNYDVMNQFKDRGRNDSQDKI